MFDYLRLGSVFTVVGDAFRLAVCPNTLRPLAIAGGSRTYAVKGTSFKHTTQVVSNYEEQK